MRILVVEDEKRIADFLGRGLESAGYAVDPSLIRGGSWDPTTVDEVVRAEREEK